MVSEGRKINMINFCQYYLYQHILLFPHFCIKFWVILVMLLAISAMLGIYDPHPFFPFFSILFIEIYPKTFTSFFYSFGSTCIVYSLFLGIGLSS